MKVFVKKLHKNAIIPMYMTDGAVGCDFCSLIDINILPYETTKQIFKVPTGISVELPQGYEINIRARSGLSKIYPNYIVITGGGTIDFDYTGEIIVFIINNTDTGWNIQKGDRIAQGIIHKIERVVFEEVDELSQTKRGDGGYGSTGI